MNDFLLALAHLWPFGLLIVIVSGLAYVTASSVTEQEDR